MVPSRTDQPINDEEIALTRDEITFQDDELRFFARAGYHRGSLLGRSLGGDFDFALFTEDRALAHLEKSFADHWDWSGDFSYFHYSDGTERVSGYSAIDFTTARQTATIYGRFTPLQSRFLAADDGLEFVDVASGGWRYSLWIVEDVELAATYLYVDYSDENAEHYGKASAAWRFPRISPVSIGVAGAIDEFDRVSPRYNEYFAGTEGDFTYTAINERSQHYWLYVRVLF